MYRDPPVPVLTDELDTSHKIGQSDWGISEIGESDWSTPKIDHSWFLLFEVHITLGFKSEVITFIIYLFIKSLASYR
jgi:hypothetical protein